MLAQPATPTAMIRPLGAAVAVHTGLVAGLILGVLAAAGLFGSGLDVLRATVLLAGGPWLVGSWFGLAVVVLVSRRRALDLGLAVVGASMARMLTALFIGLVLFLTQNPDGRAFWTIFLVAGLGVLIAESLWAVSNLNRAAGQAGRVGA